MNRCGLLLFFFLFVSCKSHFHEPEGKYDRLHSSYTNDDYIIQIREPENYDKREDYNIVVVADGTIGLGEYVLGTNKNWKADIPANCIIITIGHTGNWESKRRRDFIPSDISGNNEENFGNADKFYSFLKAEFIPFINKKYSHYKSRSFIGHSFSGLFCLYAALKNEKLFDMYFAVSPSVWANSGELLKIEETFSKNNEDLSATINIYVGGLEIFNKVLSSSTTFYDHMIARGYKNLSISMDHIGGANHSSVRKPAVDKILMEASQ